MRMTVSESDPHHRGIGPGFGLVHAVKQTSLFQEWPSHHDGRMFLRITNRRDNDDAAFII